MKYQALQHGEILLKPISADKMPKLKAEKHKKFIVGHSKTGHHHVLESKTEFEVMTDKEKGDLYLRLFEPAKLVHKKTYDMHRTLDVPATTFKVLHKTEYDPFSRLVKEVKD